MSFSWTPHRFSGGALALDVANSVIVRHDPERSIDRFEAPGQMERFPQAAAAFCAERELFGELVAVAPSQKAGFLRLREAIDRYFRARILDAATDALLADLLSEMSETLRAAAPDGLDAATVRSTLRLIGMPEDQRMKICGNCGWLFIDRSKNRSRTWCDMSVCGNRVKASRHYRRGKGEETR